MLVGRADGRLGELGSAASVSAVDSMGADLDCGIGVDELAPVVAVLCGGGTEASVVEGIELREEGALVDYELVDCGLEGCRSVVYIQVVCRRVACIPVEVYDTPVARDMLIREHEQLELDGELQCAPYMELWLP